MNNYPNRAPVGRHPFPTSIRNPPPYHYPTQQVNTNNVIGTYGSSVNHQFVHQNDQPQARYYLPRPLCNFPRSHCQLPQACCNFPQPTVNLPRQTSSELMPPAFPPNLRTRAPQSTQQQFQPTNRVETNESSSQTEPMESAQLNIMQNLSKCVSNLMETNKQLNTHLEKEKIMNQKVLAELNVFKTQLEESQDEVEELKNANVLALKKAEDKINEAVNEQNIYKENYKKLNELLIRATNSIDEKEKQVEDLQKKLRESESEVIRQADTIKKFQQSEEMLSQNLEEKNVQIKNVEVKLNETYEDLAKSCMELAHEIAANENLTKNNENLKETVDILQAKITNLLMEQEQFNSKVATLNATLHMKNEELCKHSNELESLQKNSDVKFNELFLEVESAFENCELKLFGNKTRSFVATSNEDALSFEPSSSLSMKKTLACPSDAASKNVESHFLRNQSPVQNSNSPAKRKYKKDAARENCKRMKTRSSVTNSKKNDRRKKV